MPLRILHVISQIGVGGCELQLLELCRRMNPAKWRCGVCYYAPNPDNMVKEFSETGVDLFYIDKTSIALPKFVFRLAKVIRSFRPDVIHTWQRSPNLWGRVVGLSCGCTRFVASDRTMRPLYDGMIWRIIEMMLSPFSLRLGNSQAVAENARNMLSVPRQRIRVIHNGVLVPPRDRRKDRDSVREEVGLSPDQHLVLTVGRLTAAKDYPTLFRAADEVTRDRPNVTFLCAGHGEKQQELADLHKQLNLADRLIMLGLRRDVPRLLSAADIFCLPSRWEGFPNALAEALAAGLPAISTNFEGVEEIVRQDRTGLIVPVGDHRAMAAAVTRMLSDEWFRLSIATAGQQWAMENLSWSRVVSEMESLYLSLVDRGDGTV